MNQSIIKIEGLVNECFRGIADHTLGSDVLSPQIKLINNNLKMILELIGEIKDDYSQKPLSTSGSYSQRDIKPDREKKILIKIAYVMSRFDFLIINDILKSDYNQTVTFNFLSHKLDVKSNTLKNYRDMFDPHVKQENSARRGWVGKELFHDFLEIKNSWDTLDYEEIKEKISKIIS
jgi:hypothetical protein